jgi:signal peptide peptidase SppA
MIAFRHVAARFFNRPLWIQPEAAETIGAFLLSRMSELRAGGGSSAEDDAGETKQFFRPTEGADGSIEFHSPRMSRFHGDYLKGDDGRPLPYRRTPEGTAIITMVGELVNRGAWVGASSGLISYEGFTHQMRVARDDGSTKRVVLDMETPGGEAIGAFEAAAVTREVAAIKPVTALVNGMAASAGYAIASGASRIVTIPTGICGSIGVVLMHLDYSKLLEEEGIKPTLIFAGDHKVDGNPFEPLPKEVRQDMQAKVASFYDQFVATVAQGRGMDAAKVIDTQARVFKGQDAVDVGLADAVGTFESVLAEMNSAHSGFSKGATMNDKTGATAADNAGITQADSNAAIAAAAAAAQTRIKTILNAKDAAGRGKLASHLALDTDMSAEAAIAILANSAKEPEQRGGSRLDGNVPSPRVDSSEGKPDAEVIAGRWDGIVAQINKETARTSSR